MKLRNMPATALIVAGLAGIVGLASLVGPVGPVGLVEPTGFGGAAGFAGLPGLAYADELDASASAASADAVATDATATDAAATGAAADGSGETGEADGAGGAGAAGDDVDKNNIVDPAQRADNSFIYDTTIETLFEQASLYDERTVQVFGEVIGDLIRATGERGRSWITLTSTDSENKSTISVLISDEQAKQVDHYGRYGVEGTILQVRGTYHQACSEHDGLPDIHVTSAEALSRGADTPDRASPEMFLPGVFLIVMGLVLMAVYYFARERSR